MLQDEDRDEDAGDEQRHNKARVSSSAVGLDLNPHSDVPGALLGGAAALNADSDVPEPAAERASKRRHTARAASRTLPCTSSADNKPTYLQPDPTGPRTCTGDVGMNWDSGITVRSGPEAGVEHATSFLHNAIPSTNSTALPNACKQLGNPAAVDPASAFESAAICHADKKPRLSAPVPAASPFADMAATAAACAGLPSAASLPAARDAAALLACAGRNDTSGQQHPAPAWLTSAGLELRRLMHELGIAAAAPLAVTARPSRALSSREPLCLPPPRVHRDLDGLLLRGASNGRGSSGCGGGLQLPQHSAAGPHRTSSSMGLSGTPQLGGGAGARGGERTGVALGYALHAAGAPGVSGVQGGVLRQQQQQQQPQQRDSSWRSGNRGGVSKGLMGSDMAEYYMQDLL